MDPESADINSENQLLLPTMPISVQTNIRIQVTANAVVKVLKVITLVQPGSPSSRHKWSVYRQWSEVRQLVLVQKFGSTGRKLESHFGRYV